MGTLWIGLGIIEGIVVVLFVTFWIGFSIQFTAALWMGMGMGFCCLWSSCLMCFSWCCWTAGYWLCLLCCLLVLLCCWLSCLLVLLCFRLA